MSVPALFGRPSAFVPIGMSVVALIVVLVSVTWFGAVREADEGAAAHLWQLLIAGQLPVVAFFAIRWLPRMPRPALAVLAVPDLALLTAFLPVYLLHF